jgi:hypothetical protein
MVIPSPSGPVATEVRRRGRVTAPFVFLLYVGVPLLFVAGTYVLPIDADWKLYIVPGATLAIALLCYRWQWCRPVLWPGAGKYLTGFCAVWMTLQATVLEWAEITITVPAAIPAGLAGGLLGWLLGRWASRTMHQPPVAELGDSPYHVRYPLRGATDCAVQIGGSDVGILRTTRSWSVNGTTSSTRGPSYRLADVHSVRVVQLSGTETVRLPVLGLRSVGQLAAAGPALAFTVRPQPKVELPDYVEQLVQGTEETPSEWVLPIDDADVIAQILLRRQARATR